MTRQAVTTVEATYRATTPMFCGSANPQTTAELRLPSFKGALRFWWRALAWSRLGANLTRMQKLARIRDEEARLFGSSDGGQSQVLMSVKPPRPHQCKKGEVLTEPGSGRPVGAGVRYLGYGLMEAFASRNKGTEAGELTRPCLMAPFEFTVRMATCMRAAPQSLVDALMALGMLGGIGARSRKGFGSLALGSLLIDGASAWHPPTSPDEVRARIKALYGEGATGRTSSSLPPITAISAGSRHLVVTGGRVGAVGLLDRLGREQVRYRSWGRNGRVLGNVPSEQNFKGDHDLMERPHWRRDAHPERIAFGLPHNYSGRNGQVGPADRALDRRASPMFIHIHECAGQAVAVVSFLPAEFLPKGKRMISVGGRNVPLAAEDKLYQPIHGFLDRLIDPRQRKESLTAKEVRL